MEYRTNRRTGDRISVLELGASSIAKAGEKAGVAALRSALEKGVLDYIQTLKMEAKRALV